MSVFHFQTYSLQKQTNLDSHTIIRLRQLPLVPRKVSWFLFVFVLVSGFWFLVFDLYLGIMSCVSCFVFPCPHVSFKFPCVFSLLNFHALLCLLSYKFFLWSALCLPLSVSLVPSWSAPLCSSPSLIHLASSLLTCSSSDHQCLCI